MEPPEDHVEVREVEVSLSVRDRIKKKIGWKMLKESLWIRHQHRMQAKFAGSPDERLRWEEKIEFSRFLEQESLEFMKCTGDHT